jgi:enolase
MKSILENISAMEILDSRGNPTLRVFVETMDGVKASASVPSGASTGKREAIELRDNDPQRYGGRGVRHAIENVTRIILPKLKGMDVSEQAEIDQTMKDLDGTPNKAQLGANAILGVSMAVARAAALCKRLPLYKSLSQTDDYLMPVPMMNVINGGAHADNSLDFQEFMIVPHGAPTFSEALRYGSEVFHALKAILHKQGLSTAVGDEGGFAPPLKSNEEALDYIMDAILAAGFKPGHDVSLAVDVAASGLAAGDGYNLKKSGLGQLSKDDLLGMYENWIKTYPLVAIEDGFGEDDWTGFKSMTASLGDKTQIIGDDIYVTDGRLIARGISENASNAALIKLNQIGTVTETLDAISLCRKAGWGTVISHRSGETEDTFIADFSVATGAGQIKTGSLCRSERIAKYNRLLEIERELGQHAPYRSTF